MEGKIFARVGVIVFVAIVVTATVVEMNRKDKEPVTLTPLAPAPPAPNPVRKNLRHCQTLGEAALRDSECLHLWAEERDRFLGHAPTSSVFPSIVAPTATGVTATESTSADQVRPTAPTKPMQPKVR